jgi:hypothetical protein
MVTVRELHGHSENYGLAAVISVRNKELTRIQIR